MVIIMELNKIYQGDCLEELKKLPDNSINCCITSPPYYGLRDYGVDSQIGLEETPELYVEKLVDVFREVKRVFKKDGTLWLNLGDSYSGSCKGEGGTYELSKKQNSNRGSHYGKDQGVKRKFKINLKPKDLIGIPWMVAFALRADGWYLRQDIIWSKPNPMPEGVTDRCTKSHEYIFLLSKSQTYYFDNGSIQEKCVTTGIHTNHKYTKSSKIYGSKHNNPNSGLSAFEVGEHRNKRSVWNVVTKPFSEAHFATFPEDLILPCVLAGCPENGIVLDPFMGAGTTAVVAVKNNRNYVGIELNPEYIKIAEKRILEPVEIKTIGYAKTKLNNDYPILF
jgi:DNA modification methylase